MERFKIFVEMFQALYRKIQISLVEKLAFVGWTFPILKEHERQIRKLPIGVAWGSAEEVEHGCLLSRNARPLSTNHTPVPVKYPSRNVAFCLRLVTIPFIRWDEKAGLRRDAIRSQGLTRLRRNAKEASL